MDDATGHVFAYLLDGRGGGEPLSFEEAGRPPRPGHLVWLHLDYRAEDVRAWLERESGLDPVIRRILLSEESRPRSVPHGDGLLVSLRGVNLNPGAQPDDMISLRLWVEPGRVITLRHRKLKAVRDVEATLLEGAGPKDEGDFLAALSEALLQRMSASLGDLDDRVDALEEKILKTSNAQIRAEISELRRQIIAMRRYLAPQRDVLAHLQAEKVPWLDDVHRARLREAADRTTRYVEDLDAARDRASVAHEELASRLAEQMNRTMYVLSIVAAIFLPLGLLTGLLGINVGGIPGADDGAAFWVVCAFLGLVAGLQVWLFKRMHWL